MLTRHIVDPDIKIRNLPTHCQANALCWPVPQNLSYGSAMPVQTAVKNPAILSYHAMRRVVGIIALALPFVLAGGAIVLPLLGPGHSLPAPLFQRAISDYYYTPVGSIYIGSLFVIASFLMSSRGYERIDRVAGYLAGFFALGVALFPSENPYSSWYSQFQIDIGYVHTVFAALMFLAIAFFCLFLFPRSSEKHLSKRKRHRNAIYRICGVAIVIANCIMTSLSLPGVYVRLRPAHPLLLTESLAMICFGVAWLTKGEGILSDRPHNHHAHTA